ncbi:hypothetical protein ACQWF9_25030, partial [Salmonella enterica subsp. enterica serovar Infantis]
GTCGFLRRLACMIILINLIISIELNCLLLQGVWQNCNYMGEMIRERGAVFIVLYIEAIRDTMTEVSVPPLTE